MLKMPKLLRSFIVCQLYQHQTKNMALVCWNSINFWDKFFVSTKRLATLTSNCFKYDAVLLLMNVLSYFCLLMFKAIMKGFGLIINRKYCQSNWIRLFNNGQMGWKNNRRLVFCQLRMLFSSVCVFYFPFSQNELMMHW